MEVMQIPATASRLRNVLVQVMTHPRAAGEFVATAADLIAVDERYDCWFVRVAKSSKSLQEIEEVLQMSDNITDDVEFAWRQYEDSSGADCSQLLVILRSSVSQLREAIGIAVGGA